MCSCTRAILPGVGGYVRSPQLPALSFRSWEGAGCGSWEATAEGCSVGRWGCRADEQPPSHPPSPKRRKLQTFSFPVGDNCVGMLDSLSSPRFLIALVKQMSGCEGGKDCPLPCLIYMKAVEVSV